MMNLTSQVTTEFLFPYAIPQRWLDLLTSVWNQSIFTLNWLQHYRRAVATNSLDLPPVEICVTKVEKDWVYSCKIGRDFRLDKTKSWDSDNVEFRPCCNIVKPKWVTEPPISSYSAIDLRKVFAKKRCEWVAESDVPMVYVNDFISCVVIPAWEAYQKGDRGKPKYRDKDRDGVKSITSDSFRGQCRIDGNQVKLPGFEVAEIWGLDTRLTKKITALVSSIEGTAAFDRKMEKLKQESIRAAAKDAGRSRKDLSPQELGEISDRIDTEHLRQKAIEYFSSPGSFCLISRDGKTYLQLSAELPTGRVTQSDKIVAVDSGIHLLINSSGGLQVDHQDFSKEEARIVRLQAVLAKKTPGSKNYAKLTEKIRQIQGQVRRSRKARQAYFASQIADVNGTIKLKEIRVKASIGRPIPRPDGDGGYRPNGAADQADQHRKITGSAIGQFGVLLEQQAKKRDRSFEKVKIDLDAEPEEILGFMPETSPSATGTQAPTERAGEGETQASGKSDTATARNSRSIRKKQGPLNENLAVTPKPLDRPSRNRRREKKIG